MGDVASVAVVMPAWNEAEGIGAFLIEIHMAFRGHHKVQFIIVDDASADDTAAAAHAAAIPHTVVVRNDRNRGHGPSMTLALRLGAETDADFILSTDGDGQFLGPELASLVDQAWSSGADVVEGVRIRDNEPLYRRVASLVTRALVAARAGTWPRDANTPTRVYRRDSLPDLLKRIPAESLVPNLHLSSVARSEGWSIIERPVTVRPRLGSTAAGTTWGRQSRLVPPRRFVIFCLRATQEWVSVALRRDAQRN